MEDTQDTTAFGSESVFVQALCEAFGDSPSFLSFPYLLKREVGVGRSIADVVAFSGDSDFSGGAFTTKESVILSVLRQGPTRIDIL